MEFVLRIDFGSTPEKDLKDYTSYIRDRLTEVDVQLQGHYQPCVGLVKSYDMVYGFEDK